MKKTKIVLGFGRLTDSEIETQSLAIASAMTNNTNFPEPQPSLADLNNSIQLFSNSLAIANGGDRVKIILKNEARVNLEQTLTQLANYCSLIAKGNRGILASSNFTLNAESFTAKTLAFPENFTVEVGNNPGEALVYLNPVANAKSYVFLWGAAPVLNESWFHSIQSKPWCTITGLTPGTTYQFKIGIGGTNNQAVYTKVVSQMAV